MIEKKEDIDLLIYNTFINRTLPNLELLLLVNSVTKKNISIILEDRERDLAVQEALAQQRDTIVGLKKYIEYP